MSDDNNDGATDTGQVSVAELLARNGAKVGTGGRRRRGMAGGITVAELTGEIPVVRQPEPAPDAEAPETPDVPETAEAPAEPQRRPAPQPERPQPERPQPVQRQPAPQIPAPQRPQPVQRPVNQPPRPLPAFGAANAMRPEPALFSSGPSVAADRLRAETREPAPIDDSADDEVTNENEIVKSPDDVTVLTPAVDLEKKPELDEDPEPDEDDAPPSATSTRGPVRQWLALLGQGVVAIVLGALLFKGFERLWEMLPWVALVLAFFVIVGLVAVVRVLRRTDDIVSILLAVVVGGFVTLGPLAFMLSTT